MTSSQAGSVSHTWSERSRGQGPGWLQQTGAPDKDLAIWRVNHGMTLKGPQRRRSSTTVIGSSSVRTISDLTRPGSGRVRSGR